ncbi:hypothetical protein FVE85_0544 [Porphyridium purpureum]|uniref:Uncharacterized protein n=1 Tax=Porphyridium purpureum TaxID=35688 RepID=A0A5J4Z073_PORPP|nr:hypothetical protein FVE85_0544 [Porphyridium purpureum]|eukprot:POR9622..scf208_2
MNPGLLAHKRVEDRRSRGCNLVDVQLMASVGSPNLPSQSLCILELLHILKLPRDRAHLAREQLPQNCDGSAFRQVRWQGLKPGIFIAREILQRPQTYTLTSCQCNNRAVPSILRQQASTISSRS